MERMPHHASTQIDLTQESLRGGVPPFNGGAGGRNPQIGVLPSLEKSKPTGIHHLPLCLVQQLTDPYPELTLFSFVAILQQPQAFE
jgi:hypothetical protein